MEPNNSAAPPFPGTVHILQDAAGQPRKRFVGKLLAHVSTGEHRKLPRWLTLDLYLKQDGTYVLHRIGYSVVYHAVDGCEGGEKITYAELLEITDEGEACPKCKPRSFEGIKEALQRNPDNREVVSLEHNYYKVIELADVPSVIRELEFVPKNSTTGRRTISRPGQELLLRASAHDPRIMEVDQSVQDI